MKTSLLVRLICDKELTPLPGKGRKKRYCSDRCKQTGYRTRLKRNVFIARHLLQNYHQLPVLSLFPGIGLLDQAFEEMGFCVVRGPDLLWGGDIHTFHPTQGYFQGIIGGPPCQAFSRLRYFVDYNGYKTAPNLIPEYERCVREGGYLTYICGLQDHNFDNVWPHCPYMHLLTVFYDREQETVAVTLTFDGTTFAVPNEEPAILYYAFTRNRPFPDVLQYSFPAWYGAEVRISISTPTGKKEITYLLTKETIIPESQTITLDITIDKPDKPLKILKR